MSRSLKKGPLINERLLKKVMLQKQGSARDVIKTWARDCQIPPEFVGHIFGVHNGKHFISVKIVEGMVGHRLGEFSITRHFKGHGRVVARDISKT